VAAREMKEAPGVRRNRGIAVIGNRAAAR
jgi:hypothetical protein